MLRNHLSAPPTPDKHASRRIKKIVYFFAGFRIGGEILVSIKSFFSRDCICVSLDGSVSSCNRVKKYLS